MSAQDYDYVKVLRKIRSEMERMASLENEQELKARMKKSSGLVPRPAPADPEKTGKAARNPVETWLLQMRKARDNTLHPNKEKDEFEPFEFSED